jgi:hypothetical protein
VDKGHVGFYTGKLQATDVGDYMESTVILEVGVSNTGTRYVCINTKLRSKFSGHEWFVVEGGGERKWPAIFTL